MELWGHKIIKSEVIGAPLFLSLSLSPSLPPSLPPSLATSYGGESEDSDWGPGRGEEEEEEEEEVRELVEDAKDFMRNKKMWKTD